VQLQAVIALQALDQLERHHAQHPLRLAQELDRLGFVDQIVLLHAGVEDQVADEHPIRAGRFAVADLQDPACHQLHRLGAGAGSRT
jgi:hypothetical protein